MEVSGRLGHKILRTLIYMVSGPAIVVTRSTFLLLDFCSLDRFGMNITFGKERL